ncbi:MAG: hypothetical protein ACXVNN_00955 [Bacteroidia bacterium]
MKKTFFPLLIILSLNCFSQEANKHKEPQSTFVIKINNTEYLLTDGEELKLDSTFKNPTVSVKLSEYKKFNDGGISFKYSKHFSYAFSEDTGYKNWTLSGNDFTLTLFEIDDATKMDDIINGMVKQFGKKNCSIESIKKELGNKYLNGKRINVKLVGQNLTIDFYEIKLDDNKSRFISFQDVLGENNAPSEEGIKTINLIDNTIKYQ